MTLNMGGPMSLASDRDALDHETSRATDLIAHADAAAWFRHCGYSGQVT